MQLVTFKMGEETLKKLDRAVREFSFASRTEFLRAAIRDKMAYLERERAFANFEKLRGYSKDRPMSDEELEIAREEAFEKVKAELK